MVSMHILSKILLFAALMPLGLAIACDIFDDWQATPAETDPETQQRVAEQVPNVLRCDVELRRFLADVSHPVVTADGANVGVSYVQSQHDGIARRAVGILVSRQ